MLRLYLSGLEVDVCKSIKLVHHDIDIIGTDTCRESSHPDSLILSCHRHEFSGSMPELLFIEIFRNHVHATRIAHKDNVVCKLFRTKVKVEHGSVSVYNKF